MDARSTQPTSPSLSWPLAGSLLLTAATVALVCERPSSMLHSWGQIVSLATLYLLAAVSVHALAVWGVCKVRDQTDTAGPSLVWPAIWAAWIAIVWLPLIALLTSEHSPWVAIVLPVTAIFGTLLIQGRTAQPVNAEDLTADLTADLEADRAAAHAAGHPAPHALFHVETAPPLWRVLLPAMFTAVTAQMGFVLLAAGHNWTGGCLLGAAAVYPVERWLGRSGTAAPQVRGRPWHWTSATNSIVVWLMLVLALIPFLAMYAAGAVAGLLGLPPAAPPRIAPPALSHSHSFGYSGVVLFTPHKSREILLPQPVTVPDALKKPREIAFDGSYWFFKDPDTRPQPNARTAHGDPIKNRVRSTDQDPLRVEAHQPLGRPVALSCCRALRVNVTNADNVPGTISLEVLLRDTASRKVRSVSLGSVVLASSAVSPMPLQRPPVEDSVVFPIPRSLAPGTHGGTFNEITVRIQPERSRSLAGPQVAIKNFLLEP